MFGFSPLNLIQCFFLSELFSWMNGMIFGLDNNQSIFWIIKKVCCMYVRKPAKDEQKHSWNFES